MSKFRFNILTGENAADKYAAIANKDPFCFYLLQTGVGYLGTTKLFDASMLEGASQPQTQFFRAVKACVITEDDMANDNISKPDGTNVGDAGLLFTADVDDSDDGDETLYFVPIKSAEINKVDQIDEEDPGDDVPTSAAVVDFVMRAIEDKVSFEIDGDTEGSESGGNSGISTANLQIDDTLKITNGVLSVAEPIRRATQTEYDALSAEERQGFFIITDSDASTASVQSLMEDGTPATVAADASNVYSTEETVIGTWTDGRPIYRQTISCKFSSVSNASGAGNQTVAHIPGIVIINSYGWFIGSNNYNERFAIPSYYNDKVILGVHYEIEEGDVKLYVKYPLSDYGCEYTLTVEYVKDSDVAND